MTDAHYSTMEGESSYFLSRSLSWEEYIQ